MHFESKKDRKIRELQEENERLQKEYLEQLDRNNKLSETLEGAVAKLEKEVAKDRRSAFAQEIGLLPCESPACEYCKNAVWYSDKDGRHIAGCRKGIQCADFVEAEPQKEASAPVSVNVTTPYLGVPISSPYSPILPALGLPRW